MRLDFTDIAGVLTEKIAENAGVPVYHAPAGAAGEKVIYTLAPMEYDGEWEKMSLNLRFISASSAEARRRVEAVSRALCSPGDGISFTAGGYGVSVVRRPASGSGFIGRTGHFFVNAEFEVTRRLTSKT